MSVACKADEEERRQSHCIKHVRTHTRDGPREFAKLRLGKEKTEDKTRGLLLRGVKEDDERERKRGSQDSHSQTLMPAGS